MIHPNASSTATVRSLFVIDPDKIIRLMIIYPASTGRNFYEVLRVLDALQVSTRMCSGHTGRLEAGRRCNCSALL